MPGAVPKPLAPFLFAVIPAKAGIHGATTSASARWIPAFAGMTAFGPGGHGREHRHSPSP